MFKKLRSNSTSQSRTSESGINNSRRYSSPNPVNFEILHRGNSPIIQNDNDLSPLTTTQSNKSATLSEAETLYIDRQQRLELQDNYIDNFTMYLPFVIRQMRLLETRRYYESDRPSRNSTSDNSNSSNQNEPGANHILVPMDDSFDDTSTIFEDTHIPMEAYAASNFKILDKGLTDFTIKRSFILVNGMLKHNMYIFPSDESFELFKSLRLNVKKDRKNSIVVYDHHGTIKRVSSTTKREDLTHDDIIIDDRPHIVPLDQKLKGLGLPLFKVTVPYLSSFRKNTPFIMFKKFKEIPSAPDLNSQDEIEFETFNFCLVYSKYFQNYRRFIFEFHPTNKPSFKLLMFQSNFRPFADFAYKNTRFRVIGPSMISGVVQHYNPHMRLLIVDENKPSLVDDVINKKPSTGFMKKKSSDICPSFDMNDPDTFVNPIPNNSFATEIGSSQLPQPSFISNDLPPFGSFKDSILYQNAQLLPKKYSEVGKIQIYQDKDTVQGNDLNSTLSVDIDSLVILCIMHTLREVSIRNSGRTQSPGSFGFAGSLARQSYSFDPPNPGVFL